MRELVFVGDRDMVKSRRKQALEQAHLHYITALTNRSRRSAGCIPNTATGAIPRTDLRCGARECATCCARTKRKPRVISIVVQDKLEKLEAKIVARNDELRLAQWKLDGRSVVSSPIIFIDDS